MFKIIIIIVDLLTFIVVAPGVIPQSFSNLSNLVSLRLSNVTFQGLRKVFFYFLIILFVL